MNALNFATIQRNALNARPFHWPQSARVAVCPQRMPADAWRVVSLLIADALAAGMAVSVYDENAYILRASRDLADITAALGSTGGVSLLRLTRSGAFVGHVWLTYAHGSDVCADWTDNAVTNALVNRVSYPLAVAA